MVRHGKWLLIFAFALFWITIVKGEDSDTLSIQVVGERTYGSTIVLPDSLSRHIYLQDQLLRLQAEGYLLAAVVSSDLRSPQHLSVVIETFQRFEWMALRAGNLTDHLLLQSGFDPLAFDRKPLNYESLARLFEKILDQSQRTGFPFASIRLDSLAKIGNGFSASIYYDPGPLIRFDTLKITGNSKTRPVFLGKTLRIVPGAPFSQRNVDRSLKSIRTIPYLQVSGEPRLSFQNEEATLYLPVNDRRINSIDGIIGVLPNEIEGNRLLVTGQFDMVLYNVSGKGRNYRINWQRLSQYSQNLRLDATEPMVFGSGLDVSASFYLLKEDTTFLNRDVKFSLGYRVNPSLYLSFFNRRQAGDLLSTFHLREATELPSAADFRFNNYGMNLEYMDLDDAFFPKRGGRAVLDVGIGNKRLLQNTGLPPQLYQNLLTRTLQYYLQADYSYYHLWKPTFGAVFQVQAGYMENPNLLLNDLFRLGGLKTIRGFNENHFFASQYVHATIEPRFYFDTSTYFLIFADAAVMVNRLPTLVRDFPYSFGGGFSIQTSGGLFHFVYALGTSADQPFGFNYSRIHFGYTGRF
ncbi:BamA/TamA family outer membrane protein [Lunatimonas salinarum]|uniref:BamA/TamA family outer membrane protein n=1 Tax=Lunatimonas salinarum TaxID=1774590 RepID=UPI001FD739D5|nr:BamA/TamA family outer membrane protein [Lunatimonas salinarum]